MTKSIFFCRAFTTFCAIAFSIEISSAQNFTVKGTVVDTQGQPVIGADIIEQGTTNGTVTDQDGVFSLTAKNGAYLKISCIGYATQEIKAAEIVNVVLEDDNEFLNEVVIVGYGVQEKVNLTGAVSSIDVAKTIDSRPVTDIGRALQGVVPGLIVTTDSGEIGSAPTIRIRGNISSPNGAGNPLILVDNVEVSDISLVNPDDIESISVLKDAASSSIYGARAAFGVLLITTKSKAKTDKVSVKYSNNFSFRSPTKIPEQLPGWQQGEMNLIGAKNAAVNPESVNYYTVIGSIRVDRQSINEMKAYWEQYGYGSEFGDEMVLGRDFYFRDGGMYCIRTWNWYDRYVRDSAPQQNHTLSVSGGNGTTCYNVSANYLNQQGMMKINSDRLSRFNINSSLNSDINKYLSFRVGYMFTKSDYAYPMNYNSDLYDAMYYLYRWQAVYPYGTYNGYEFRSGLSELAHAPSQTRETKFSRINAGVSVKPINDLTVDIDGSYYTTETRFKRYGDISAINTIDIFSAITGEEGLVPKMYVSSKYDYVEQQDGRTEAYALNAIATYKKHLGNHNLTAMAGTNIEKSEYKYMMAKRNGLLEPSKSELNIATGTQETDAEHTWWAIAGFFARINWSFKDKFLVELNGRYDGSSRFSTNHKFAFFPSGSVGYRITQEPWMQSLKPALSSLKVRASYGKMGNQDVGTDRFVSTLSTTTGTWLIDGKKVQATSKPTIVSDALTWEKVTTFDVGVDARFLSDAIGFTFDWYCRTTSDILTAANLPLTLGADAPYENEGAIRTDGWEFSVDYHKAFDSGFQFNVTGSLSDSRTIVTKWTNNTAIPQYVATGSGWYSTSVYKEGMVLGDIWGLTFDRFLTSDDFNADGTLKADIPNQTQVFQANYRFAPGDVLFKDLDGDGVIKKGETTNNPGDYSVIGNCFPRFQFGLNIDAAYKGFDLNLFFQGVAKKDMWVAGNQVLPGFTSGEPYYAGQTDYWTEENPDAFYPRLYVYGQLLKGNYTINDRYMLRMGYLRLKQLTLGYTFPKKWMDRLHIAKSRIYFTGENLFTFDKVKAAIDPETGVRTSGGASDARNFGRSYPYVKAMSFGIQITF